MREILFKAKRVKNGEWIEGSLIDLDIDEFDLEGSEVVGNIFDNKELLQEGYK